MPQVGAGGFFPQVDLAETSRSGLTFNGETTTTRELPSDTRQQRATGVAHLGAHRYFDFLCGSYCIHLLITPPGFFRNQTPLEELVRHVRLPRGCAIVLTEYKSTGSTDQNWVAATGNMELQELIRYSEKIAERRWTDPQIDWSGVKVLAESSPRGALAFGGRS